MTPETATLMASYNRWMNDRLYEAASQLDDAALAAERGAFFGSILGTLNHLVVADLIWLHRFAEHRPACRSLGALTGLPQPHSLRQPLAADLAGLRVLRRELDGVIERWVAELTPAHLAGELRYGNLAGVFTSRPFAALLLHFFNHQTHHRGQATTLLSQCGVDVGVTDLLALIPRHEG